jgi:hypothetical protein
MPAASIYLLQDYLDDADADTDTGSYFLLEDLFVKHFEQDCSSKSSCNSII